MNWRPTFGGRAGACSCDPKRFDAFSVIGSKILSRNFQIVAGLEIHPELWTVAKIQAQPKRGVSRYTSPIVHNFGDPVRRNADRFRKLVLRETVLGQEFFLEHFARRNRRKFILRHVLAPFGPRKASLTARLNCGLIGEHSPDF
jgi:hypothetical protein